MSHQQSIKILLWNHFRGPGLNWSDRQKNMLVKQELKAAVAEERRGTAFASRFEDEKEAISMAIRWVCRNKCDKALMCSDSQSLLRAVASCIEPFPDIAHLIRQSSVDFMMQWVPVHCLLSKQ